MHSHTYIYTNMQYVHQAHYGNAGGIHTAKPMYAIQGNAVYGTQYNTKVPVGKALYEVRGNKWYATEHHPDGPSAHALYEVQGDKVHTTSFHPAHDATTHAFEITSSLHHA